MNTNKETLFQARADRISAACKLEQVDRLPVLFQGIGVMPLLMGMTVPEILKDIDRYHDVVLEFLDRYGQGVLDGLVLHPLSWWHILMSDNWLAQIRLEGIEDEKNAVWQLVEKEAMSAQDYSYIPDIGFDAFKQRLLPFILDMKDYQRTMDNRHENYSGVLSRFREHGYPVVCWDASTTPFEAFCGARSTTSFFIDLYERPDEVEAAMRASMPHFIDKALNIANSCGVPRVAIGGLFSASSMISQKHWNRFVFPYLQQLICALHEQDVQAVLHLDGCWDRDLARFHEVPKASCVFSLDGNTDIRRCKEILGDHAAIIGDVPALLFSSGTPDDIRKYVKELVRDIGTSGLLLSPGCDTPFNTSLENIESYISACSEFSTN